MGIGQTINQLRRKVKLTQAEFGKVFGVSSKTVQKWERGLSTPDLEKIILISKYFEVSIDSLLSESGRNEKDTGDKAVSGQFRLGNVFL